MTNFYEYRLHQIELLLRAYRTNGEGFDEEVNKLKKERNEILDELIKD